MNLVEYVDPALGSDKLVPAVGSGLTEVGQNLLVPSYSTLDRALNA